MHLEALYDLRFFGIPVVILHLVTGLHYATDSATTCEGRVLSFFPVNEGGRPVSLPHDLFIASMDWALGRHISPK